MELSAKLWRQMSMNKKYRLITTSIILLFLVGGLVFWLACKENRNQKTSTMARSRVTAPDLEIPNEKTPELPTIESTLIAKIYFDEGSSEGPYKTINIYRNGNWTYDYTIYGSQFHLLGRIEVGIVSDLNESVESDAKDLKSDKNPTVICEDKNPGSPYFTYEYIDSDEYSQFESCFIAKYESEKLFKLTSEIVDEILDEVNTVAVTF